jgi:lipopolysaccharide export system protein LptA
MNKEQGMLAEGRQQVGRIPVISRHRLVLLLWPLLLFFTNASNAQVVTPRPRNDTMRLVNLIHADRFGYQKIDSATELQTLVGNVQLEQEGTYFSGDSVVIKNGKIVEAFGNVHINDKDSIHTRSQYLLYYVDTKKATLRNQVQLTDGKTTLTSEDLQYDVNMRIGEYHTGGKLVNEKSVLTSREGRYYADLKDAYFYGNVKLKDPQYDLESDSLLYNTETELTTFIAPTKIVDSAGRTIRTSEGYYDLKNSRGYFGKRPRIQDGPVFITAETIDTNEGNGISILTGNAVYRDTAEGVSVLANRIETWRDKGSFRATQQPLMIIKQENDSIFIAADTLFSGRLTDLLAASDTTAQKDSLQAATDSAAQNDSLQAAVKTDSVQTTNGNDSTNRYFQAFHHVRIFSDSMQAVSDSLFYSAKDSVFKLFTEPVLWTGNTQVTGDTIYLHTKNRKPELLQVFENGMTIEKSGPEMYNQVRGNRLFGYFVDGNMDRMQAKGNAESIYYVTDEDSAVVGINKVVGDIIEFRFLNKELNRVVVIGDPTGTMVPVLQATEQDKILRDFKWLESRRPKSRFELFGN